MPRGNGTGPMGAGPGTGRGMGYCGGYNLSGFVNPVPGFRSSFSFGRGGMGRGWRHRFYATGIPGWVPPSPEQETVDLKAQADLLKAHLDTIQNRIEEIKSK